MPEIKLHLATEVVPLWKKTEEELEAEGVPPPYWAFAWAGGQALARYILDRREFTAGKNVLDFGSGSGLVGIAASLAGAGAVLCADTDPFAASAIRLNAEVNHARLAVTTDDIIGHADPWNVIMIGDMCYERPLAERLLEWLKARHKAGVKILIGDPGRSYFPKDGMEQLALYQVQTTRELEDREIRQTGVYTFSLT